MHTLYITIYDIPPTDIVVYFKEWWDYKDIAYQIFISNSYITFI